MHTAFPPSEEKSVVFITSHLITFLHALVELDQLKSSESIHQFSLYIFTGHELSLREQQSEFHNLLSMLQSGGFFSRRFVIRSISSFEQASKRLKTAHNVSALFTTRLDHGITLSVLKSFSAISCTSIPFTIFEIGESLGTSCSLYSYRAKIKRRLTLARLQLRFRVKKLYTVTRSSRRPSVLDVMRQCLNYYFSLSPHFTPKSIFLASETSQKTNIIILFPYIKFPRPLLQSRLSGEVSDTVDLSLVDTSILLPPAASNILNRLFTFISSLPFDPDLPSTTFILQTHPKNLTHKLLVHNIFSIYAQNSSAFNARITMDSLQHISSESLAYCASMSKIQTYFLGFGTNLLPVQLLLEGSSSRCYLVPISAPESSSVKSTNILSRSERLRYKHLSKLLGGPSA